MITINWSITKLLKDDAGVVKVMFGLIDATDDFGNNVQKEIQSPTKPSDGELVPFDQLDEETVLTWFKELHEADLVPIILSELDVMRLDSVEGAELPWGS